MVPENIEQPVEQNAHWGVPRRLIFVALFVAVGISTTYFVVQSHRLFDEVIQNISTFKTTEGRGFLKEYKSKASPNQIDILARSALEIDTTDARHNRSTSALVTRTWLRFTSASFGAILIAFGAVFILSRVSVDTTTVSGGWEKAKISLVFNSPGLFLVVVGAVLLVIPITSSQTIDTDDTASFFEKSAPSQGDRSENVGRLGERTTNFCNATPKPSGC